MGHIYLETTADCVSSSFIRRRELTPVIIYFGPSPYTWPTISRLHYGRTMHRHGEVCNYIWFAPCMISYGKYVVRSYERLHSNTRPCSKAAHTVPSWTRSFYAFQSVNSARVCLFLLHIASITISHQATRYKYNSCVMIIKMCFYKRVIVAMINGMCVPWSLGACVHFYVRSMT